MTILALSKRHLAGVLSITLASMTVAEVDAQVVSAPSYAPRTQATYQPSQQTPIYQQQYAASTAQAPVVQTQVPVQAQTPVVQQQPVYAQPQVAYTQAPQVYVQPRVPGQAVAATNSYQPTAAPQYRVAMEAPSPTAEMIPAGTPPMQSIAPALEPQPQHVHAPAMSNYSAAAVNSECGCQGGAQPTTPWDSYVAAPSGCATGDCGTSYDSCAPVCNVGCAPPRPKRQWFAGIYGLYMARGDVDKTPVAVAVPDVTAITTPYYPAGGSDAFLFTSDADFDPEFGAAIRFGSTFGRDNCGCYQPFAWEIGYWALDEGDAMFAITNPGTISSTNNYRIYGMRNYAGLEYDRDGAGGGTYAYRPLNEYGDYQVPIENGAPNDVRLLGVRVRQSFDVQNLELNFWRFGCPVEAGCGSGCSSCSTGCASNCGTGCNPCATRRPPRRFFINGLLGVRYMKIDDNMETAFAFTGVDGAGDPNAGEPTDYVGFPYDDDNVFFDDLQVDNELIGFQLGCSMNWLVGCKWNFFADSNFGIYGNQADVYNRVYSGGGGTIRYVSDGSDAVVNASKTEVAFLGELRTGVGYQISCNCRLTAAYRIIALSGVALSGEQYLNYTNAELASHIDTNGSLFLHGLQTGVEYKY